MTFQEFLHDQHGLALYLIGLGAFHVVFYGGLVLVKIYPHLVAATSSHKAAEAARMLTRSW